MKKAKSGIHIKKSHRGLLHKDLGIKQGEKIPASKLKVKSTDSAAVKKRKVFAQNAKKWHHAQAGVDLPNANSSAPRKIGVYPQQIEAQMYQMDPNLQSALFPDLGAAPNPQVETISNYGQNPQLAQNQVPDTGMDTAYYNSQIHGQPKQKKGYNGQWGDAALAGLLAVDALIPNRKQPSFVNRPGLSYNEHPYGTGSSALLEDGGEMAGGGWIKHAINPSHKGWCTPLSNPHCTGHRRALAMRFKHGDLHKGEDGMMLSEEGYRRDSPDRFEPSLRIPSNDISMDGVDFPVYGIDNTGHQRVMYPGEHHKFKGNYVDEYPMAQNGAAISDSTRYFAFNPANTQMSPYMVDLHPQQVGYNAQGQPNMMYNYNSQLKQGMLTQEELNQYKQQFGYRPNTGGTFYAQDVKRGFLPIEASKSKMQSGGNVGAAPVYTSYDQINQANQFAKDFARRKGAPGWLAENTHVARDIGDPVVQFQHTGAAPQGPSKLATTLPTGVSVDDVFQTNEGQYGYYNNDSNFVPVDAATIYSLYGKRQRQAPVLGNATTSVAAFKKGGKMKKLQVYEQGGMMQNYYEQGGIYDLSDSEIKQLAACGYKMKFV